MQLNDINHLTKIVGKDNVRSDIADRYIYGVLPDYVPERVKQRQYTAHYEGTLR